MAKIPILYKYSSIDDAVKIIESKKMKITKPSNFNDPFDCTIPNIDFSFKEIENYFFEKPYKKIPEKIKNSYSLDSWIDDIFC